jgi:hypothetical protein
MDAELLHMEFRVEREEDQDLRTKYQSELLEFVRGRSLIDATFSKAAALLFEDEATATSISTLVMLDQKSEMKSLDSMFLWGDCGRSDDEQVML